MKILLLITVTIPNWGKYNPRSDRTITVWLRFENKFFDDQALWSLSDSAKLLFIFFLCEASKIQKDTVSLNLDYIATKRKRTIKQIREDLKALTDSGVLNPSTGGRAPDKIPATRQDNTEQDSSNAEAGTARSALFADALPENYQKGIRLITEEAWLAAYGDRQWIALELKKAVAWISANPSRAPKSYFARFFTNWLARGWESYRKKTPAGPRAINYGPAKALSEPSERGMKPLSEILAGMTASEALKKQKEKQRGDDA